MRNTLVPDLSDDDKAYVRALVMHEDGAVMAFNKPSGLASQTRGSRGRNLDYLLWAFARSNGKRPRLVHRLDAGTSGLILAGKTQPAAAFLSGAFAERRVEKTYLALVGEGVPDAEEGMVCAPIARLTVDGRDRIVTGDAAALQGRSAQTAWRVLARGATASLMELKPKTGRMHQIRVHLAHLGCPILGDAIYGEGGDGAPRLMLHASALQLAHPDGGEIDLNASLPEDMATCLAALDLDYAAS